MSEREPIPGWRAELNRRELEAGNAPAQPWPLFARWYDQALAADLIEPTAMTLATADADGRPAARTVLLKGFDEDGFCFYSNYQSTKARELAANPRAALVFWWDRLERQIRVRGQVEILAPEVSDAYFAHRPRGSQIGAHASPQSRIIAGRGELQDAFDRAEQRFADHNVPRPEHWGGYRLRPESIEFWQARENRLHDRLRYRREGSAWRCERLAP